MVNRWPNLLTCFAQSSAAAYRNWEGPLVGPYNFSRFRVLVGPPKQHFTFPSAFTADELGHSITSFLLLAVKGELPLLPNTGNIFHHIRQPIADILHSLG